MDDRLADALVYLGQLDQHDGDREGKQHPEAIARTLETTARLRERQRSHAWTTTIRGLSIIDKSVPLRPGKVRADVVSFRHRGAD
jgi:hypothetical protein